MDPPPAPPLLPFDDPWQLRTKSWTFEELVTPGQAMSLNHMRDLTGQRNVSLVREGTQLSVSPGALDGCGASAAMQA
jgi:hypothetical protein